MLNTRNTVSIKADGYERSKDNIRKSRRGDYPRLILLERARPRFNRRSPVSTVISVAE